jgi:hypothetical protein
LSTEKVLELKQWIILQLSKLLSARFLVTRSPSDLEESETLARELVRDFRGDPDDGNPRQGRGPQRIQDEEEARERPKESEDFHRPDAESVLAKAALARSLRLKYKFHNGTLDDLDGAVRLLEDALRRAKRVVEFSKIDMDNMANDWGLLMRARYSALGELSDLDSGIQIMLSALEGTSIFSSCMFLFLAW